MIYYRINQEKCRQNVVLWCENDIVGCPYLNRHLQVLTALVHKSQVGTHGLVLSAVLLAELLDAAVQAVGT